MASELNMYESQVQEYKYEIERLARELQDVKKKYYTQKRKEQQARSVNNSRFRLILDEWLFIPLSLGSRICIVMSATKFP